MSTRRFSADELRLLVRRGGFSVKILAVQLGVGVRTLERRFSEQFRTRPKVWIMHERMSLAPPLLAEGRSNKEIAAVLNYSCQSNFCRDFKRCFGCSPQRFADPCTVDRKLSCFDKQLSLFDNQTALAGRTGFRTLNARYPSAPREEP